MSPVPSLAGAGELGPTKVDRSPTLDAIRGGAILLMIADHLLVLALALGGPELLLLPRQTVTRAAMPVFLGLSGWLAAVHRVPGPGRLLVLGWWGLWLSVLAEATGLMPSPDILLVCALIGPAYGLAVRYPLTVAGVALVLFVNQPVGWAGYEPGLLLGFFALGALAARAYAVPPDPDPHAPPAAVEALPSWLAGVGRHPLPIYVGHVAGLHVLFLLLS